MRLLILLLLVACNGSPVQSVTAQPAGPNGLPRVWVLDGGICTGTGWPDSPLECSFETDTTVSGTGSAGDPLSADPDFAASAYFCDGSDGTITFDGTSTVLGLVPSSSTYRLTRDVCCSSCTIDAGVTVIADWRFLDNGTLTLNGKLARNGNNASGSTAGAGQPNTSWFSLVTAGAGGNGSTGTGAAGTAVNVGRDMDCSNSGGASNGGAGSNCKGGGGGNGTNAGGAGGTVNFVTAGAMSGRRNNPLGGMDGFANLLNANTMGSTTGGGGGGGNGSVAGGGGGGGGGVMYIAARKVVGTGTIEAKGGNGGNGNAGGNTGGGGGGAGGIIFVLIGSGSYPTTDVTGGSGGSPGGTGTAGGTGGVGAVSLLRVGS